MVEYFLGQELAFRFLAGWVADRAGGAACERDGLVAAELETTQGEQGNEVAEVEAVSGRVEATIQGGRSFFETLRQFVHGGAVVDESSPL